MTVSELEAGSARLGLLANGNPLGLAYVPYAIASMQMVEQAAAVQQAAVGTQEVSGTIGDVSAAAGRTGESASLVLGAASRLAGEAAGLKQEVAKFLAAVKAA